MRKSFVFLMIASLSMAALSGCGSSSSGGSSSGGGTVAPSSGAEVAQDGSGIVFPLASPMSYTFHYHARDMYNFNEDWPVFQKMTELTNISLINTASEVGTNSVTEFIFELNNQLPSDLYGGNNIATYFMQYGPDGAFIPLNDYWDYMPNFRAFLDDNPDVEAVITAHDGNIYHIPYIQEGGVARTYWIRTDWLDNLGLPMPTTVEQLDACEMLRAHVKFNEVCPPQITSNLQTN